MLNCLLYIYYVWSDIMKLNRITAFFLTVLLIGGVSESLFSVYATNDVNVSNTESMMPDHTMLTYQSLEDFEKELTDGTINEKLSGDREDMRIGSSIYELSSTVKVDGKKTKLKEIFCTYRDVTYIYDKEVSFSYYPNYTVDEALKESYKNTKKTARKTKTIDGNKVYMVQSTQGYNDYYIYTWVKNDCLFEITIPQSMSLTYGFSLCKVNDRLESSSTNDNSSVKNTKKRIIKKTT